MRCTPSDCDQTTHLRVPGSWRSPGLAPAATLPSVSLAWDATDVNVSEGQALVQAGHDLQGLPALLLMAGGGGGGTKCVVVWRFDWATPHTLAARHQKVGGVEGAF